MEINEKIILLAIGICAALIWFFFFKNPKKIHLRQLLQMGILLEERGEAFYHSLSERSLNPDVKDLCEKLAQAEHKHKELIEETLSHWLDLPMSEFSRSQIDSELHKKGLFLNPPSLDATEKILLKYAVEQEYKSVDFYAGFEKEFPEAWKTMHVERLVMEEKDHAARLTDLLSKIQ